MSRDELAVLDGGKCILQLRGVRPFLSEKYDLTQHPNYKLTADYDPKNYLYTIAGNLCRDSYKKIRESLLEEQSLEIQDCLHPPETDELLNRLTIKAALDRLPAELREVIILYYFQELTDVELRLS